MSGPLTVANSETLRRRDKAPRKLKFEPTLRQVFVVCLIGLAIHFGAVIWILSSGLVDRIDSQHAAALIGESAWNRLLISIPSISNTRRLSTL